MDDNLPKNPAELLGVLRTLIPNKSTGIDFSTLKYAIYARKSTTSDERQERSIEDQIDDCIDKVVTPYELNLIEGQTIEEKGSAKEPGIRPKFDALIQSVKDGKIDGIIAWHPDRLARNMKEAGEIIDLLDKTILKDLRFATFTFENSPTGKMLLGISFVLSKQYSEHLSESVTRGNERRTEKGYFFDEMKHGYKIVDGRLYPDTTDDNNGFNNIRRAFEMRLEGHTQKEIAEWLNGVGYKVAKRYIVKNDELREGERRIKNVHYKWDKSSISKLFIDPVYAGVLKYGGKLANLEEFYDFTPVVSVSEFMTINKITDLSDPKLVSSFTVKKREDIKADLLRNVVMCGYCGKSFSSGLTFKTLKGGRVAYYFYRCETEGCLFKNKSVRAKVVLDYAYDFLNSHLFTTRSNYAYYLQEARQRTIENTKQLNSEAKSYTKQIGVIRGEYENAKKAVAKNPQLAKHYDLDKLADDIDKAQSAMSRLNQQISDTKEGLITYEKYLELFSNISVKLQKTKSMKVRDEILRKFFLNFHIKAFGVGKKRRYEITHKLNEPFAGFIKSNDFFDGRGERT